MPIGSRSTRPARIAKSSSSASAFATRSSASSPKRSPAPRKRASYFPMRMSSSRVLRRFFRSRSAPSMIAGSTPTPGAIPSTTSRRTDGPALPAAATTPTRFATKLANVTRSAYSNAAFTSRVSCVSVNPPPREPVATVMWSSAGRTGSVTAGAYSARRPDLAAVRSRGEDQRPLLRRHPASARTPGMGDPSAEETYLPLVDSRRNEGRIPEPVSTFSRRPPIGYRHQPVGLPGRDGNPARRAPSHPEADRVALPALRPDREPASGSRTFGTNIPPIGALASERMGFPTQKPLAPLERILVASSNPGDVVLEPFLQMRHGARCGSQARPALNRDRRHLPVHRCLRARLRKSLTRVWRTSR